MATVEIQFVDEEEFLELEACLASVERSRNGRLGEHKRGLDQADGSLPAAPAKRPATQSPISLKHQQHVNSSKKVACTSAIPTLQRSHGQEQQVQQAASAASLSANKAHGVAWQQPCLQQQQRQQQQRQQALNCMLVGIDQQQLMQHTGAHAQHQQEQQCCSYSHKPLQSNPVPQQLAVSDVMASVYSEQQQFHQRQQLPLVEQCQHTVHGQHMQLHNRADCKLDTVQQQQPTTSQLNSAAWQAQPQQPWQHDQRQPRQQGTTTQRPGSPKTMPLHQQKQQMPQQSLHLQYGEVGLMRTHSAPVGSDLQQLSIESAAAGSRSWAGAAAALGPAGHVVPAASSGGGQSGTRRKPGHQLCSASGSWHIAGGSCTGEVPPQPGGSGDNAVIDQVVGQHCKQLQQQQCQQQAAQGIDVKSSKTIASGSDTALQAGTSAVSGVTNAAGRRQLPPSLQGSLGLAGIRHSQQLQKQPQTGPQLLQQQQQQTMPHGKPQRQIEFQGVVRYSYNPMEVDWLCKQLLEAGPPKVIGLDIEWRPTFKTGQAPNRTALLQIAYAVDKDGKDWRPKVHGRGVMVLLLQIYYTGITPALQNILQRDDIMKVGVNIGGDVSKLLADFKVEVCGTDDLSDAAHSRQLRCVEGITANTECKRWSLAGLVEEVLGLELPKPQQIRLGNWECRPLSDEQRQYAALDAFASLLLHWELQALPERLTLSQQLRTAMRERAAAAVAATGSA